MPPRSLVPAVPGNYTFATKQKSTAGGSLQSVAGTSTVSVTSSGDGTGTGTIVPTSTLAGTTNNTETATYTATTGGVAANGVVQLTVPANWTAPQKTTSNAAGYVTATSGGSAVAAGNIAIAGTGPWTISVTVPSALASGQTVTITYGDTSSSAAGAATAPGPSQAANYTFTVKEKSTSGGTLTTVGVGGGTQTVAVANSADGAGTGTVAPSSTLAATTNNTETATYTAATGGVAASGVVELTVPANWTAPQKATNNAAGYVTATANGAAVAAGNISISGTGPWTIDVTVPSALASGQTVVITYGDTSVSSAGAATAPGAANAGSSTFTIKEKSTSAGTLTTVGGAQTVGVSNSADGAGTLARTSALNVERGSGGNTVSFTFTAATGGLKNGAFTIALPAGWSAPSTTSSAKGYTTSDAGTVSAAGSLITIGNLTLDGGQTVHVVYGSTVGGGSGADAPSAYNTGDQTWQAQERSTIGGALTDLASSPIVHIRDSVAPTVSGVSATDANGAYGAGQVLHLVVTFSEPVTVTGTPQLLLETGVTDESASYASGSGTSALEFDYTVQAGDTSSDLDAHDANALTLNGGTIVDAEGNAAVRTLTVGAGNSGALANAKDLVVDTTSPGASVTTPAANGLSYNGSSLPAAIAGASSDAGGSGVTSVGVAIRDGSGNYWGGSDFDQGSLTYNATGGTTGSWTYSTTTLAGKLADGHTYTITARSTDAAGNTGTATRTFSYDASAPTVTNVAATNTNGAYAAGATIHVQVSFSEPVAVTGTPKLSLNVGRTADYVSGSGTSTLAFDYTVQAGDNAATLDYNGTGSLSGGTITDAATNAADETLAAPGAAGSLSANKSIQIDTTAPTVTSVSASNADGAYRAGQTIHVQATFAEPVNVTGTPTLALNDGRSASFAGGSGTGTLTFDYTVQAGDTSGDLDYAATSSLALNGGTIADSAGNAATLTLPAVGGASSLGGQKNIVVDTTNPAEAVAIPFVDGTTYNGSSLPASISGSSSDTAGSGVASVGIAIRDGSGNYWGGSDFDQGSLTYNATGGTTGSWTYSTTTLAGKLTDGHTYTITARATDNAGNAGTAARTFVFDSSAPTVTGVTASNASGSYGAGTTIHVQVSFSEPVVVSGQPVLSLNDGEDAVYASGSGTSTLTFDDVIQSGDDVAALDYTGSGALTAGTIDDAATNHAVRTLASPGAAGSLSAAKSIRIDTTDPTESVDTPAVDGSSYDAASLPSNIAGSSGDAGGSGVATVQIAIRDGSGNYWGGTDFDQPSLSFNAIGGAPTSWTYSTATLVTKLLDGHTYTIVARATDNAGNTSTSNRTFVYDTAAPTVTNVTATNADGAYTTGQVVHVRISFDEAVDVTGSPKLALNTSPAESATYASGSGTATLTFDYTVQAGDTSADLDYATTGSLTLNGGAIEDAATNAASLTLPAVGGASSLGGQKAIAIDTTAPTVSAVSATNTDGSYGAGQTIHVRVTFSKAVTVAGGTPTLALSTSPARSATYASGSGTASLAFDYTVQAGDTASRLDAAAANALHLNGATIRDLAANDAVTTVATGAGTAGALANAKNIVVDTTAPTVTNVDVGADDRLVQGRSDRARDGQLLGARRRHRHAHPRAERRRYRVLRVGHGQRRSRLRLRRRRRRERVAPRLHRHGSPDAERRHDPRRGGERRDDDAACTGRRREPRREHDADDRHDGAHGHGDHRDERERLLQSRRRHPRADRLQRAGRRHGDAEPRPE